MSTAGKPFVFIIVERHEAASAGIAQNDLLCLPGEDPLRHIMFESMAYPVPVEKLPPMEKLFRLGFQELETSPTTRALRGRATLVPLQFQVQSTATAPLPVRPSNR